jgi:hypothetical protein
MRIPIIEATEPLPVISPEGAGRGWRAIGAAAGEAQNLANVIAKQRAEVVEKKRVLAMNSDIAFAEADTLKADTLFTTESRKGADPKTYLPVWEKTWDERVKEKLNTIKDPETKARMEINLQRNKMQRFDEESKFADGLFVNTEKAKDIPILEDYAARGKLEEGLGYIEGRKDIYKPTEIEALKGKFKEDFQRSDLIGYVDSQSPELIAEGIKKIDKNEYSSLSRTELAQRRTNALDKIARLNKENETKAEEVAIDNAIRKVKKEWPGNPDTQNLFLTNDDWQKQNGLTSKTAHMAQIRLKGEQNLIEEGKKKIKEQEERDVGNLFMEGKYGEAQKKIRLSTLLTGDEKRTWDIAIEKASQEKREKIDPNIEAAEIVVFNDMITKGVDPRVIRNAAIQTFRLSPTNKEQYINKLEAKLTGEVKEGRGDAYRDIREIIVPSVKGVSIENLIQTPQQTVAILKAQTALDDWIDSQIKGNKYPTKNEIRKMGWKLAVDYTPSFADKMKYLEQMGREITK